MELRHIRYFIVLAEELNFSRAAQRLHIAQPPLSRQIKELEEKIGATLFNRSKRHVELTPAGKVFLQKAYQILDQVEQARFNARLTTIGREGELRIAFTGAVHDLIPALKEYRKRYPKVGIVLTHMNNDEQINALNEKTIDIALLSTTIQSSNINVSPLKNLDFYVALPELHPLVKKENLLLQDLVDETFIMTPRSVGVLYYETFMSAFNKVQFTPNIEIQANDLHTVLALVASGMGVTLTPSPSVPMKGIVKRSLEDVNLSIVGSMAWHKENESTVLEEFLLFINSLYRNDEIDFNLLNN